MHILFLTNQYAYYYLINSLTNPTSFSPKSWVIITVNLGLVTTATTVTRC
jgi:hypothetical protein